jgi:hypothetical protein
MAFRSVMSRCSRVALGLGAVSLTIAACGSSTTAPAAAPTSAPASTTTAATAAPAGPPVAQIASVGTGGLAGAMNVTNISCQFPSYAGVDIVVNGTFASAPGVAVRITITPSGLTLGADTGSGSAFKERDFTGSGVTAFNASSGAQINTPMTERPGAVAVSGIGTVTSLSGSVACNAQTPGTSTLMLTGSTVDGAVSSGVNTPWVKCEPAASGSAAGGVLIIGLITAGPVTDLLDMFGQSGTSFTFFLAPENSPTDQSYAATGATVTVTATGAHFSGSAEEKVTGTTTPHTLTVSGDVVCGS